MDERELVRRARKGDREAFGELVRLYQARLRAHVARYVTRPEDVYDIVQDGFIDALEHLDRFDETKDVGPWLRAICRNRMLNHFRSKRVRQTAAQTLVDAALEETWASADPALAEGEERVAALRRCIAELDRPQRELLDLRYHQEVPLGDLARRMRRSAAALSMMLFRLRGILEKCVSRRLGSETP
jgi:RNA polymerase sigma-70 factor (ECF subfamily)